MCVLLCADDPKEQIAENLFGRSQDFKARRGSQIQTVEFPTTTIGSFPQTAGAHHQQVSLSSAAGCLMANAALGGSLECIRSTATTGLEVCSCHKVIDARMPMACSRSWLHIRRDL